jgi:hypothetical protein
MKTLFRAAFFSTAVTVLAIPCAALAADEPPVVDAILDSWEKQFKVRPTYDALNDDGNGSIVIDGLKARMSQEGQPGSISLSVAKMTLSGVNDQGDGLYEIAKADYADTKVSIVADVQIAVSAPQLAVEGWYVKAAGDDASAADKFRASMNVARKTSSGPITLEAAGMTFTSDGYLATWDGDPATGAGKAEFKLANVLIPEQVLATMDTAGMLKQLGYSSLSFDVGGNGEMSMASENFGFDFDIYYAGKDMATVKIGAGAGTIPFALVTELQSIESNAQPDPNKLMPLVQGIEVNRVRVRFEDQSITKKILPMIAAMQGMDEATLKQSAGAIVQLGLAELKNPAFTAQVVAAVNTFLNDPRSLTVLAKPAQPITVQQLMQLDPSNPGALIDQLGVVVTAND